METPPFNIPIHTSLPFLQSYNSCLKKYVVF
uniref:Uncharacterized protein n=2 Tax=unclassified Caudoviricetes TaxID=2788787 RepID=A0A8S5NIE9_9CAUD|nr:MAG TPA: hypothetical protein [Siphoviridae sp. ctUF252]DAE01557.1 MAG TPA: hypothetical protein [Siphoviridae sp. ctZHt25]DAT05038.1 MAG TPA: hypothetical protein [Caudoviricetes sp.]